MADVARPNVRRLQVRIVQATKEGRWGKVRALQRLLTHSYSGRVLAVRRVTDYIPKTDGKKMRPLGIPTMRDRAEQALHLLALDPVVETTADQNSYGFRQRRSCADAIAV